ncbi:MAG: hypothetical protein WCY61_05375, partial [Sphaerochaeta sp.]
MYSFQHCAHDGCPRYATSLSEYCLIHDPFQAIDEVLKQPLIDSGSFSNARITDEDFSSKRIVGSLFSYTTFVEVSFQRATLRNSNFSFCLF